ncbi:hypothetical protein PHYPO_G00153640 [Pangasianodon hypophthalmus]|uniref:Uncharacterized protein n=1 Tax=Pangasianodon hypophthalmus TaxID=310915 RepID=A0A5N5K250_PANHP|nr:hypothetical protein PHYPO_G00153640 [Pangasianodon hypophthalmus]
MRHFSHGYTPTPRASAFLRERARALPINPLTRERALGDKVCSRADHRANPAGSEALKGVTSLVWSFLNVDNFVSSSSADMRGVVVTAPQCNVVFFKNPLQLENRPVLFKAV